LLPTIRIKAFAKISLFKTDASPQSTTFLPLLAFMIKLFFTVLAAYLYLFNIRIQPE